MALNAVAWGFALLLVMNIFYYNFVGCSATRVSSHHQRQLKTEHLKNVWLCGGLVPHQEQLSKLETLSLDIVYSPIALLLCILDFEQAMNVGKKLSYVLIFSSSKTRVFNVLPNQDMQIKS